MEQPTEGSVELATHGAIIRMQGKVLEIEAKVNEINRMVAELQLCVNEAFKRFGL